MQRLATIIILAFSLLGLRAQEKEFMYEIGLGGGASWAYGDINKSKVVYNPSFDGSLFFRYNANPRWAFVADMSMMGIKGDSNDFDNVFPNGQHLEFDNSLWQMSIRPEFHFWNFGWENDYRERKHLVPFLTAGLGFGLASGNEEAGPYLSFPVGAGLKWKMAKRWNFSLTCLFTRTLGDIADGISDPYNLNSNNTFNSDWIGSLVLGISFDFMERCINCNKE